VLDRLPSGVSVFIDTNVFLYHLFGARPSCREFFLRIKRRDLRGVTSTVVLGEVLHQLMLSEVGERHATTSGGALRLLRRHPELIATLTKSFDAMHEITTWGLRVLPVRGGDVPMALECCRRFHLLTNDALIVATMRAHRLTHLASNDRDFTRVPGITLWRP